MWHDVDPEDFPDNGVTAVLPHPSGTRSTGFTFTVQYLISSGSSAGTMGNLAYELTADGLKCKFMSLSPVAIGWVKDSTKPWKNPFTDVSDTGWYIKAIEFVCRQDLMTGYGNGKFGPNNTLTRAQCAQILYDMKSRPAASKAVGNFSDVDYGAWYGNAVKWAIGERILVGYGDGTMRPNNSITREQLASLLWRYEGNPEPSKNELNFANAGKVSGYARKAMLWANENHIVNGKGGGVLAPKGTVTRAEAAQMLMNHLKK